MPEPGDGDGGRECSKITGTALAIIPLLASLLLSYVTADLVAKNSTRLTLQ